MLEAKLRDLLAAKIEVLEPGLQLLAVEEHIPSSIATTSFIDLLAVDTRGRWVIVEVKRSDAAARQAVHEVSKYVEAVKAHLRARDDEVRVVVASTEWRELLLPFSRYVHDTAMDVLGIKLEVETDGAVLAQPVATLPIRVGRVLAPWHEISLYKSRKRLEAGIASYDASCEAKGIQDYVLVILRAPTDYYEKAVIATARMMASFEGPREPTDEEISLAKSAMERLDHLIYFVPQMLTAPEYLQIIQRDADLYEEAKSFPENMEGEELLLALHEYAYAAKPGVSRDHFEIGYPAKFQSKLIEAEGWSIEAVLRRGAFSRNELLSDEVILGEISGDAGTSGQRLKRRVSLGSKAEISSLKAALLDCLPNNPIWHESITQQVDEAVADFPDGWLDVNVFAPSTGLFTIYFAFSREDGVLYVPTYSLMVSDGSGKLRRGYFGEVAPLKDEPLPPTTYSEIISRFYGGDIFGLLITASSGSYEARDLDVIECAGLTYSSFRCDADGEKRTFSRRKRARWEQVEPIAPFEGLHRFAEVNEHLIRIILGKIGPRHGPIWDGSSAERLVEAQLDEAEGERRDLRYIGAPDFCDLCGSPFAVEPLMIDGAMERHGGAANMCADCFMAHGVGIGWGKGQAYSKQGDGSWLMVGGFPPKE